MSNTPRLWHFTCAHAATHIGKRGLLKPNRHPLLPKLGPVVWLTSDGRPDRDDVGLTSTTLACDRMAFRYRVTGTGAIPWLDVADQAPPDVRTDLERYSQPETWWLSFDPIEAVLA